MEALPYHDNALVDRGAYHSFEIKTGSKRKGSLFHHFYYFPLSDDPHIETIAATPTAKIMV